MMIEKYVRFTRNKEEQTGCETELHAGSCEVIIQSHFTGRNHKRIRGKRHEKKGQTAISELMREISETFTVLISFVGFPFYRSVIDAKVHCFPWLCLATGTNDRHHH
jgi:hypothetical protein